tara:strand:+ start:2615 stop:3487 length:873 start_codon:yes stop_codon:yes gene_type:complete
MGIMMGPNGQLVNTSNIGNTVGANLIPNITPNIGALRNIDRPVTNDDGTITLPTIEMKSNDPGLAMGDLQKIYGTKYMPMFQWVSAQQTGSTTYDPSDFSINFAKDFEDFTKDFGIDPNDAFNQAQMERTGQRLAGATGAKAGAAFGQALVGGGDVEDAIGAGFGAINPLGFLNPKVEPSPSAYAPSESIRPQIRPDALTKASPIAAPQTALGAYGGRVADRLNPNTSAGMANLKVTGFAAGADFLTQVAMGADAMDAAKDAGKTAVLSYMAEAILPGSGGVARFLSKFF